MLGEGTIPKKEKGPTFMLKAVPPTSGPRSVEVGHNRR